MIKFDIKMPSTADLMKVAIVEIESNIMNETQSAAAPHGSVMVRFERTPEGALSGINFQGSEAAVKAARAATVD